MTRTSDGGGIHFDVLASRITCFIYFMIRSIPRVKVGDGDGGRFVTVLVDV